VYAGTLHRRFDLDPFTPPPVEAYFSFGGYNLSTALLMVLEGEPGGRPSDVPIAPVTSKAEGTHLRELMIMFKAPYFGRDLAGGASDHVMAKPAITFWLAEWRGQPAGFLSGWLHSGLCFLEDLFVHPDYRNRGIATALVHRVTHELRSQGGGAAFLEAAVEDTPKEMYRRMGFRPIALLREYWREVAT
jgi:ribosomal-protein-alanine N-acetyltransferase